jgi:hypothetical protein
MKRTMRVLAGSLLIALSPLANAADPIDTHVNALDTTAKNRGQSLVAGKIASNFNNLAGSKENSLALVNALRNGTNATLTYKTPATTPGGTSTATTATYDPPTGKLGWGNVKISLALAQDSLARAGIKNPTAEQLQAALNGGSVTVKNPDGTTTTTKLGGVLQMRADGMGWGEIAKANGTKVGPVVSQLKMSNSKVAALPPATAGASAVQTPKEHGNAYGRGVVTGAGGSATNVAAASGGKPASPGAGVVTGGGGNAAGVTTGNGGGNGKGNAGGNGNGKGKGS